MEETYSVFQVRLINEENKLFQMEVPVGKPIPEGWTDDRLSLDYSGKVNEQVDTNANLAKQLAEAKIKDLMTQKQMAQLAIKVATLENGGK